MDANLLNKLRKILALVDTKDEAGNEGQAQVAAVKLQEFLEQHNLSMADLEQKGQAAPGVVKNEIDLGKAAFTWKLELADMIAEHFYCASITGKYGRFQHQKMVRFVGRPDNVESLGMLYQWLIDQIKRFSSDDRKKHFERTGEHIDPLRWQVSYGRGVVSRLGDRLEQIMRRKQKHAAKESGGALVIHHQAEISDWLEEKYGYRTDGKETKRERERREKEEAEAKRLAELRKTDLEAFYRECPEERPLTPEQAAEQARADKRAEARERRNARRRSSYTSRGLGHYRGGSGDWRKENESWRAREAGQGAASNINLEPFLTGGKPTIGTPTKKLR